MEAFHRREKSHALPDGKTGVGGGGGAGPKSLSFGEVSPVEPQPRGGALKRDVLK